MKYKYKYLIKFLYIFLFIFNFSGCATTSSKEIDVSQLPNVKDLSETFLKYYKPVQRDFVVEMTSYSLPLDITNILNLKEVESKYLSKPEHLHLIIKNGFVVVDGGKVDDITLPYKWIISQEIPIYVTADTPLHLFHIQFDETLKEIEEEFFYPDILALTKVLLKESDRDYKILTGDLKEAAKRNVAYFSVALKQFEPEFKPPEYVSELVLWECGQIEKHSGLPDYKIAREKSIFKIPEDYSQYKPRGHYTRSDTLKRYFRGMMWYGRMTFLLKGHESFGPVIPPAEALTDRLTAKIQTLQAALISASCGKFKLPDGRKLVDVWDRIYSVTAFYAGFADDLTLYDYREAMREVFGSRLNTGDLEREEKFAQLLFELSKLKSPAIFSGTGGAGLDPGGFEGHKFISVKELDKILTHTMGFRFMGQRYIPDSYILGQLVSPAVGTIPGVIPKRFTVVYIPDERIQPDRAYSIRGFPRGLDVFSVFGSKRAHEHIVNYTDHEYPLYGEQVESLRVEFSKLSEKDWNRNLYWSWLYALKDLVEQRENGYQTYQKTEAYLDRQLNTALSSWSALRHNTILYAKQSYTPVHVGITSVQPEPPAPKGFVEPLPEFYARILTTTKMAYEGLKELDVLSIDSEARLRSLVGTLERLYEICKRQIENKPLTSEDNNFLINFPNALKIAIGDVDEEGLKTSIIADVHTDINTRLTLEEASGYLDYIIVAYMLPDGDIVLAVGPILSYYEFKHPMSDRLTDEKWRNMLKRDETPQRPIWIRSFYRE
jgi:hypothetical protein